MSGLQTGKGCDQPGQTCTTELDRTGGEAQGSDRLEMPVQRVQQLSRDGVKHGDGAIHAAAGQPPAVWALSNTQDKLLLLEGVLCLRGINVRGGSTQTPFGTMLDRHPKVPLAAVGSAGHTAGSVSVDCSTEASTLYILILLELPPGLRQTPVLEIAASRCIEGDSCVQAARTLLMVSTCCSKEQRPLCAWLQYKGHAPRLRWLRFYDSLRAVVVKVPHADEGVQGAGGSVCPSWVDHHRNDAESVTRVGVN